MKGQSSVAEVPPIFLILQCISFSVFFHYHHDPHKLTPITFTSSSLHDTHSSKINSTTVCLREKEVFTKAQPTDVFTSICGKIWMGHSLLKQFTATGSSWMMLQPWLNSPQKNAVKICEAGKPLFISLSGPLMLSNAVAEPIFSICFCQRLLAQPSLITDKTKVITSSKQVSGDCHNNICIGMAYVQLNLLQIMTITFLFQAIAVFSRFFGIFRRICFFQ